MSEIIPAIIPQDYDDLRQHLLEVKGHTKRVQIDIVDGIYTPGAPSSWPLNREDADMFEKITSQEEGMPLWQDFEFDIDLMTVDSVKYAEQWVLAGASRIIFHLGSLKKDNLDEFRNFVKEKGEFIDIGYAIQIDESVSLFDELGISNPSFVQCMGAREIGIQGMEFDSDALGKIKELREKFPETQVAVDIGVNDITGKKAIEAGANVLIVGSYIFKSENPIKTLEELKKL